MTRCPKCGRFARGEILLYVDGGMFFARRWSRCKQDGPLPAHGSNPLRISAMA